MFLYYCFIMKMKTKSLNFTKEESEAIYKIVKEYNEDLPETGERYYNDYNDIYEKPIKRKIISSILKKVGQQLPRKEEIDKEFLRKKYHPFNNEIDEKVYRILEKAFEQLKTVEIEYFNMESAECKKRKIDIYYKSRRYTIAYCHLRNGIRKFRTSRIVSAKLTNDNYNIPREFNKNNY